MVTPLIRDMRPDDIPAVVTMIGALSHFHGDSSAVTAETLARDTDPAAPWMCVKVAEHQSQLIGYMVLLPLAKIADGLRGLDINQMYVAPAYRGTGVARLFMQAATTQARSLSCSYMFICTAPTNLAAQEAYRAIGFTDHPDAGGPRFRMQL